MKSKNHLFLIYKCLSAMLLLTAVFLALPQTSVAQDAVASSSTQLWNVTTNPLGWVTGPNLNLEYKLNNHWSFGAGVNYVDYDMLHFQNSWEYGWGGSLFVIYNFNETFTDTWFVSLEGNLSEGRLGRRSDFDGNIYSGEVTRSGFHADGGYRWFWDHFNFTLGLGIGTITTSGSDIVDKNGSILESIPFTTVNIDGQAAIGWTF